MTSEPASAGIVETSVSNRAGLIPPYGVIACAVVFFWSVSIRALLFAIMPTIVADLQLSSAAGGIVISSILLGYCVGSWGGGWLPGPRKVRIMAGVAISLPAAALYSAADSLGMLLGAGFLVGANVGIYLPLGLSIIFGAGGEGRRAYYMAIHEVAATMASFSGAAYVAVILAWTDWHGAILTWCLVGSVALLAFVPVRNQGGTVGHHRATLSLPISAPLVFSIIIQAVATTLVMGLISVLPLVLVRGWGMDQAHAASVVGSTRLAGLGGVAIMGLFADRWGHARTMIGMLVFCVAGTVAMSLGGAGSLFVVGMLVLAVGASGHIALLPLVIAEAFHPTQRERVLALTSGVGGFLGLVASPALFGVLLDAGLPNGPILLAGAGALVSIFAISRIAARTKS